MAHLPRYFRDQGIEINPPRWLKILLDEGYFSQYSPLGIQQCECQQHASLKTTSLRPNSRRPVAVMPESVSFPG